LRCGCDRWLALMPEPDLDRWLGDPEIRTIHRRSAAVDPEALWHAAEAVTVGELPTLGRVVRWRIPGTPADLPLRDLFRRYPFVVLEEGDEWSVSGMCGKVWTLKRDYPRLAGAGDFEGWDEAGSVRILFAHWIEQDEDGVPALVSESRVKAVDRRGKLRMRALWAALGRFERLIGGEGLRRAAELAEHR
jgi:hypothetical protein